MKLINSSYEILEQGEGLQGIYEQIERVGKTCYKSEVKGGESAKNFVEKMIANQHYAMLEHGTVYLKFPNMSPSGTPEMSILCGNPYTRWILTTRDGNGTYYTLVTTNLRVLVENRLFEWAKDFICEPTEDHIKRVTVRFITDRGVSHELVRHRVFSFAQESTRYCNYSRDKFSNELTFIIPSWANNKDEISYTHTFDVEEREKLQEDFGKSYGGLIHQLSLIEDEYLYQLKEGRTPQEARQVLPNALKTEICMTGFVDSTGWIHFFHLRALDQTGPAHPDMKALACPLYAEFCQRGYIDNSN